MKAAWYERKGPPQEVLRYGDLPDLSPGPGAVRVRVAFSAVNPSDTKMRSGFGGLTQMPYPRIVPHNDGSGVIDAVGPGVPASRVGERVWVYEAQRDGSAFGTAAEYVVVPDHKAVRLPTESDFETAASLGIPAMTAHRCLFMDGPIQGRTILVAGGAGAVGHMTIQLARWAGARVITTVSRPEQATVAAAAGAELVINRRSEDVVKRIQEFTDGQGVDRVVEVAFEANLGLDIAVLRNNGVIAAYNSGPAESRPAVPFRTMMYQGLSVHFVLVYVMSRTAHEEAARDINAALRAGALRTHLGRCLPLSEAAQAHALQESGEVIGKILLRPGTLG